MLFTSPFLFAFYIKNGTGPAYRRIPVPLIHIIILRWTHGKTTRGLTTVPPPGLYSH